jgi:hypothetical protein
MNTFTWTPEAVEQMLHLWLAKGWSAGMIAREMGTTKNSIIGKVHREQAKRGFPKRPSPIVAKPKPYSRRKPAVPDKPVGFVLRRKPQKGVFVPPEGQLASIVDVTGCRWAVRDDASFVGGHAFCNGPQAHGSAYCEHHKAVNVASYSATLIKKTISAAIHRYKKVA